jgi:hypothetical protein
MYDEEEEEKDEFNMGEDGEMTDIELEAINDYEEESPEHDS